VIPKGNVFPDEIADGAHVPPKSSNDMVWRWSYETYQKQKDNLVFLETKTSPLVNEN
jgi:adenine-specific DNA-methyltransferase